ncbi:MAG: M3 family metallopeptidase [Micropruina sp.]
MTLDQTNPFAAPSTLPYELSPFARILPEHYLPAFEAGIAEKLAELKALATDPEPPTEENVIGAWERSGQLLGRVLAAFYSKQPADTDDELDAIDAAAAPMLAALADAVNLDRGLYQRLIALKGRVDAGEVTLDPPASYWLSESIKGFERSGVNLGEADQTRLKELNARIAELQTSFGRVNRSGSVAAAVIVDYAAELDGLSASGIAGCAEAAIAAGHPGRYLIKIDNTTEQRTLSSLTNRDLRRRIHLAAVGRGWGGDFDTRPFAIELARARAERATLLGFAHHADYVASNACARTSAAVNEMLGRLGPAAAANAGREAAELVPLLRQTYPEARLEPWDWEFLAERLREERYQLDATLLRPYLELERVLQQGVFFAATALFGITFSERLDLVGWNPECRIFEVSEADGSPLGLFVADFYTRPGKQGGAWMNNIIDQNHQLDELAVVTNTLNLVKPPAGEPTLIDWDDVITLFHEFGHALHGLLSDVRYRSQSGTSTPRDFVEFPSQVNEMWAFDPGVLASFAVHYETGEPMPREWIETMVASQNFQQGYKSTQLLAAMILDQAWHTTPLAELPTDVEQVEAFEADALTRAGVNYPLVPTRYRSTYFAHIFEGGYAAGYYSYIWSEVLDADTAAWFRSRGGLTSENGEHYRRRLLAVGGSVDAMEAYRDFRGADPDLTHLLVRRGLTV